MDPANKYAGVGFFGQGIWHNMFIKKEILKPELLDRCYFGYMVEFEELGL